VNLLAEFTLDRDAMIALNLSASQAESVLATVRQWRETNEAAQNKVLPNTLHQKIGAVRRLEKAIRMGPSDAELAPALAVLSAEIFCTFLREFSPPDRAAFLSGVSAWTVPVSVTRFAIKDGDAIMGLQVSKFTRLRA
jgi:hypothetical protein